MNTPPELNDSSIFNVRFRPYWMIAALLLLLLNCICGGSGSPTAPASAPQVLQPTVSATKSLPTANPTKGPPGVSQPPPAPSAPAAASSTLVTLQILNQTNGLVFCYIYVSPVSSDSWGQDYLGENRTLEPGYSMSLEIPTGVYDFRVDNCDGKELAAKYDVAMNSDYAWTLNGSGSTATCGDGVCGSDEQCAEDCGSGGLGPGSGSYCGDGTCGPYDENALNCPNDCGYCGDNICGNDEQCAEDCGSGGLGSGSYCGDGTCGPYNENALNCPNDCGYCGDGVCGNDEQCAEDCGSGGNIGSYCGDGTCGPYDENALNCPNDCGYCGDGVCGNEEQCAEDCGSGGNP